MKNKLINLCFIPTWLITLWDAHFAVLSRCTTLRRLICHFKNFILIDMKVSTALRGVLMTSSLRRPQRSGYNTQRSQAVLADGNVEPAIDGVVTRAPSVVGQISQLPVPETCPTESTCIDNFSAASWKRHHYIPICLREHRIWWCGLSAGGAWVMMSSKHLAMRTHGIVSFNVA